MPRPHKYPQLTQTLSDGQTEAEVLADRDYWLELGKTLGWTLYGFSYRNVGNFWTDPLHHCLLQLRGHERDAVMEAIRKAKS